LLVVVVVCIAYHVNNNKENSFDGSCENRLRPSTIEVDQALLQDGILLSFCCNGRKVKSLSQGPLLSAALLVVILQALRNVQCQGRILQQALRLLLLLFDLPRPHWF